MRNLRFYSPWPLNRTPWTTGRTIWSALRQPPGNRLEALKGNREGQHSIRINDQWRICFRWVEGHAEDVEIVDDHEGKETPHVGPDPAGPPR
ncbi:hypothetical protein GCM10027256_25630 [Novispirillum itersonii subsp. nipponicum]